MLPGDMGTYHIIGYHVCKAPSLFSSHHAVEALELTEFFKDCLADFHPHLLDDFTAMAQNRVDVQDKYVEVF